ncbi:unnamed protein product [Cylicocyclus nassatus]|uniref:Uncharacterized protein n=1 Tax=Cylicocyclus nassatus TaxID=53992 RepID=A0AA36GL15_CYLNA|nr:unnamed protein product [Cylicocyclus nassatus]
MKSASTVERIWFQDPEQLSKEIEGDHKKTPLVPPARPPNGRRGVVIHVVAVTADVCEKVELASSDEFISCSVLLLHISSKTTREILSQVLQIGTLFPKQWNARTLAVTSWCHIKEIFVAASYRYPHLKK